MAQSLLAKLDELQDKVTMLAKALEQSRFDERKSHERAQLLARENEQLRRKVDHAQGQINQMLNQWFPELELNSEK
ncbi:MAG: hypothetical protein ACK4FF_14030 [Limnobacter sp.]|uniref:hypothetical protein n=1 Tax=Limnobacter sp. TaxID=2003368 RepID=UPI0039187AEB